MSFDEQSLPVPNPLLSDEILDRLAALDDKWKNMIPDNDQRCLVFEGLALAIQTHFQGENKDGGIHISLDDVIDLFLVVNPKNNSVVRKRHPNS